MLTFLNKCQVNVDVTTQLIGKNKNTRRRLSRSRDVCRSDVTVPQKRRKTNGHGGGKNTSRPPALGAAAAGGGWGETAAQENRPVLSTSLTSSRRSERESATDVSVICVGGVLDKLSATLKLRRTFYGTARILRNRYCLLSVEVVRRLGVDFSGLYLGWSKGDQKWRSFRVCPSHLCFDVTTLQKDLSVTSKRHDSHLFFN